VSLDAQAVLANTPFLLTRCSADLRYVFASEAYAAMIGRRAEDMAGQKIVDIMGDEGFQTIRPHVEAVLAGHRVEYETEVHFQGVGPRLLHVIYTPEKDPLGAVRGWIASIIDITERRRAQERIAILRGQIDDVLDRAVDARGLNRHVLIDKALSLHRELLLVEATTPAAAFPSPDDPKPPPSA
jgi:PAS domain S-box-containing protein